MTNLRKSVVGVTLACLSACGAPEQSTVDQFFLAARSNDNSTLAAMAAVSPPESIASWDAVEVSSRSTEPFALPKLRTQLAAAEEERDATMKEGKTYLEEHPSLDVIIPKLQDDPEFEFTGERGEIQKEWTGLIEQRKEKERAFQELERAVATDTRLANKSMMSQVSIEELDGDVAVTEMLFTLKYDSGEEHPYTVTLRKYNLSAQQSDRTEPARWIISGIEGTTPEARAAATAPSPETHEPAAKAPAAKVAAATATERGQATPSRRTAAPQEFEGVARVQILEPETKVEANDVVSTIRVRNVSRGWLTKFTVSEFWYDEQGNATRGGSRTHQGPFMPDEVIELELRTGKNPKFFQNQFQFSHENGDVTATVVSSFP